MISLKFQHRPIDVHIDLRLYRRLAMLLISVDQCCRSGAASFNQLHFINSLIMDSELRKSFKQFKANKDSPNKLSPSADPYLNRCVNYAMAADLLEHKALRNGFNVKITPEGKKFVEDLRERTLTKDLFQIVKEIGKINNTDIQRYTYDEVK